MCDREGIDRDAVDVYEAAVRGTTLPELKARALDLAQQFYGPAARLEILAVEYVGNRVMDLVARSRGTVFVRCLNVEEAEASVECVDLEQLRQDGA
jgi:hypothetical protein